MSVVPFNGVSFLGNMPRQNSMVPQMSMYKKQAGNRRFDIKEIPKPPPLMNNSIQRPHTMKVLGKMNHNSVIIPRPQPVPSTDNMNPKQGYARGQPKGLAYRPECPNDGPIMAQADSALAWMDSKLTGQK